MATAAEVLAYAGAHGKFVETPVNITPFGAWAGVQGQPWCQAFVSFVLDSRGLGMGKIAYCPAGVAWFRDRGHLDTRPRVGDVFYLWFPRMRPSPRYAHTGFVLKVLPGGRIQTLEGNSDYAGSRTGGRVVSLIRTPGPRTVYGRPTYAGERPTLRRGSKGVDVRFLQSALGIANDGDFGPTTERAVKTFQRAHGLVDDGVVGRLTWAALG